MENPAQLIDIFLIIFIGMGPIKALLVYVGLTKDADRTLQRQVAQKAVITATVVALLLLVAGAFFMRILHFTTSALTIAGGLILLILARQCSPLPGFFVSGGRFWCCQELLTAISRGVRHGWN